MLRFFTIFETGGGFVSIKVDFIERENKSWKKERERKEVVK